MNRAIDYNADQQRLRDSEFSEWDNLKYPMGFVLVIAMFAFAVWGISAAIRG